MKKLLSIYKNIIVKRVSYEKGDETVQLDCIMVFRHKSIETKLIISQSDFNRMLSQIILNGYNIEDNVVNNFVLGEGLELVEYNFSSQTDKKVKIQNFKFNHIVKQISA
jgi:hypothetical protein